MRKYLFLVLGLLFASPSSARITSLLTLPAGEDTEVQFNDDGVFGSSTTFTYQKSLSLLTVSRGSFTVSINVPHGTSADSTLCDEAAEAGNMFIDTDATSGNQLQICEGASGWATVGAGAISGAVSTRYELDGSFVVNSATMDVISPLVLTDSSGEARLSLDISSVTLSGPLSAESPITLTSGLIAIDKSSATLLGPTIVEGEVIFNTNDGSRHDHVASDLADLNAGTDITGDLEEETHVSEHEDGGGDELDVTDLSGQLADRQKIQISTEGTQVAISSGINLIEGSNFQISGVYNEANGRVDITLNSIPPPSETGITVEDGGSEIVQTSTINFTGSQFIVTDDSGEALVALDPSSVTLLGSQIDLSGETDITVDAPITLTGSEIGIDKSSATLLGPTITEGEVIFNTNDGSRHDHVAADLDDLNAGTDITADLEEETHVTEHQNGGGDELNVAGLSGLLADPQKIAVSTDTLLGNTTHLVFVDGTNTTVEAIVGASSTTIKINSTASGGSGASVLEVFSNLDAVSSSPTASIEIAEGLTLSVDGSTAIVSVDFSSVTSRSDAILNQDTLQDDSTGYPESLWTHSLTVLGTSTFRNPAGIFQEYQATTFGGENRIVGVYKDSFDSTIGYYGVDTANLAVPITLGAGFTVQGSGLENILRVEMADPWRVALLKGHWTFLSTTTARWYDADSLNYVSFRASNTVPADSEYVLPRTTGTVDQVWAIENIDGAGLVHTYWKDDTSGSGADNLGNHTATETLKMAGFDIADVSTVTVDGISIYRNEITNALNISSTVYTGELRAGGVHGDGSSHSGSLFVLSDDGSSIHHISGILNPVSFNDDNQTSINKRDFGITTAHSIDTFHIHGQTGTVTMKAGVIVSTLAFSEASLQDLDCLGTDGSGNVGEGTCGSGGGGYDVEPATVTFQLDVGFSASTGTVSTFTVTNQLTVDGQNVCQEDGTNCLAENWTDTGATIHPTETTDEVVIGNTSPVDGAKLTVDGDADQIQFLVQGHTTQNSEYVAVEDSSQNRLFSIYSSSTVFNQISTFTVQDAAFVVTDATVSVNSLQYLFPFSHASGQLTNDGSGILTWDDLSSVYQPLDATLTDLANAPLGEADSISVGAIAAGTLSSDVIASSIAFNAVGTNQIQDASVTTEKIVWPEFTESTFTITIPISSDGDWSDEDGYSFSLPYAWTVNEVQAHVLSVSASTVTFNLQERGAATPNTTGTNVFTSYSTATTETATYTTFANAGIAEDAHVVFVTNQAHQGSDPRYTVIRILGTKD